MAKVWQGGRGDGNRRGREEYGAKPRRQQDHLTPFNYTGDELALANAISYLLDGNIKDERIVAHIVSSKEKQQQRLRVGEGVFPSWKAQIESEAGHGNVNITASISIEDLKSALKKMCEEGGLVDRVEAHEKQQRNRTDVDWSDVRLTSSFELSGALNAEVRRLLRKLNASLNIPESNDLAINKPGEIGVEAREIGFYNNKRQRE